MPLVGRQEVGLGRLLFDGLGLVEFLALGDAGESGVVLTLAERLPGLGRESRRFVVAEILPDDGHRHSEHRDHGGNEPGSKHGDLLTG